MLDPPSVVGFRSRLKRLKEELRRRMHLKVEDTAKWLGRMVDGWLNYCAAPTSSRSLYRFVDRLTRLWLRRLRCRSQKDRFSWGSLVALRAAYWPRLEIRHPWPSQCSPSAQPKGGAPCPSGHAGITESYVVKESVAVCRAWMPMAELPVGDGAGSPFMIAWETWVWRMS